MAVEEKKFLDYAGLAKYDELIKKYINDKANLTQYDIDLFAQDLRQLKDEVLNLDTSIGENTNNISIIEKNLENLSDAVDVNTGAIEDINDALDVLNGDVNTEGSIANKIDSAISQLVNGAPEALDTLKEIADWIADDTTGATSIINRVIAAEKAIDDNSKAIEALEEKSNSLKSYVDAQDKAYHNAITAIAEAKINALFLEPVEVEEGKTVAETLATLEEGQKLVLAEDDVIEEDLTIPSGAYIDANGAEFSGEVVIPEDAIVDNAVFTGKVTIG